MLCGSLHGHSFCSIRLLPRYHGVDTLNDAGALNMRDHGGDHGLTFR